MGAQQFALAMLGEMVRVLERTTVNGLLYGYSQLSLANKLTRDFRSQRGRTPLRGETWAWRNSLPALARVCKEAGLGSVEMLIEVDMPQADKRRADVVLAGKHPVTGQDSYVVVELKQWSAATRSPHGMFRVPGLDQPMQHPIEQVGSYVSGLRKGLKIFNGSGAVIGGVAYLHEACDQDVLGLYERHRGLDDGLYTQEHKDSFGTYLKGQFAPDVDSSAGDRFCHSEMMGQLRLMDCAKGELYGIEQFELVDEQITAYREVEHHAELARASDHKAMVIITGGAGTGKTAIGLKLMRRLKEMDLRVNCSNGSAAFMQTLRRHAGHTMKEAARDFRYFSSFRALASNQLQVILCDEAHRIREKSTGQGIPSTTRPGRTQLEEIVDAANVTVFFLDEHQIIKPDEVGTVEYLHAYAQERRLEISQVDLRTHFRCGGSEQYDQWIHSLLDLDHSGQTIWSDQPRFQVQVVDSPRELETIIRAYAKSGDRARITAGICWEWNDPDPAGGPLPFDIRIGDWKYPWNARSADGKCSYPSKDLWATDKRGIDQAGCVYTAQGLEYDWAGVIIGPDLRFDGDRVVTDRTMSKERSLKQCDDATADRIIKNIYKILLTRGLKGTVIYACDPGLQAKLKELVNPTATTSIVA